MLRKGPSSSDGDSLATQSRDQDLEAARNFLLALIETLLDRPSHASLEVVDYTSGVLLHLRVPGDEIQKILGDRGRTARALQTIVRIISERRGIRFRLEIERSYDCSEYVPPLEHRNAL